MREWFSIRASGGFAIAFISATVQQPTTMTTVPVENWWNENWKIFKRHTHTRTHTFIRTYRHFEWRCCCVCVFLTRVDGWSNDSNQFVCSCLLLIPNIFRSFHSIWLLLLLLLLRLLFCFNFRTFWIASNSSCQRVNRSKRHKKRFEWMHHTTKYW